MNWETINWVDTILIGIVVISALVGIARGLMRETLSVITWVITIWIAYRFADLVSQRFLLQIIGDVSISYIAAFILLLLLSLFVLGLFNMLITTLFNAVGVGSVNRVLGMVFGLLRGIIIAALLVFVSALVPEITQTSYWQRSRLVPQFSYLVNWAESRLPSDVRQGIQQSKQTLQNLIGVEPNTEEGQLNSGESTGPQGNIPERPQINAQQAAQQSAQISTLSDVGDSTGSNTLGLESLSEDTSGSAKAENSEESGKSNEALDNDPAKNSNNREGSDIQLESIQ